MRRLFVLPFLCLLLGAAPAAVRPQRIVSLNLCADGYLLALADRGQIAALTQLATDPDMSWGARQARGLRTIRGSAEDVLALRPDLILASPGKRRETMAQLRGRSIATLDLAPAESFAAITAQVREVAVAVGHPERGEALIARMAAALARVPRGVGRGRVAAYYQRRGYLTGTGTLIDELMGRVGLVNLATRLGKPSLARMSLEEMARARPDFLIVETGAERVVDQGTEMLQHPILAGIPRLRLAQAWTVCGGPGYVAAARALAAQLRAAAPVARQAGSAASSAR
ncbi:ABC transporter substrate-binding protein [Sphingomonas aracearum]|uniref:ABC transporter substrate-binding protein n=1 Tax=Sphingomonas aracearum TaxID=2283317 RepID=A0A369VUV4_9SPHN|nr:ABC transporter substrate-binding protein [Sphingomonas aracearum]RDE05639.1 ABC transporter substrate-binding protein [Sphingomonas aracearum]